MRLLQDPWPERISLWLLHTGLRLTEIARHRAAHTSDMLENFADHLSWTLITQLDAQVGTSPLQRYVSAGVVREEQVNPRGAETDGDATRRYAAPLVITIPPISVRTTRYEENR